MTATPFILLDDSLTATAPGAAGGTLLFERPERVVAVYHPSEVEAGLDAISEGLARGLHAAGFFAYELGYCLEPKLQGPLAPGPAAAAILDRTFPRARPLHRCRDEGLA